MIDIREIQIQFPKLVYTLLAKISKNGAYHRVKIS